MANPWFQFKQFTIQQQYNAMKVTTDGCLFGAMLPTLPGEGKGFKVIDIGTGTGLLSLMFAQKNPEASITAVELDPGSAAEAARNFDSVSLGKFIQPIATDILQFNPPHLFDLIITNPPFYEKQLTAPDAAKNRAHHDESLTLDGLLQSLDRLMTPEGSAWILLPAYRQEILPTLLSRYSFHLYSCCQIRPHPGKAPFRVVVQIGRRPQETLLESLVIKTDDQAYSPAFVNYLKPYYLFL